MARVIRGGAVRVPAELVAAKQTAKEIVENAHREATEILERVRGEERDRALAELASEHVRIEQVRRHHIHERGGQVAKLAAEAARTLVGHAVDLEPALVARFVDEALDRVRRATEVRVRVHPRDASQLSDRDLAIVTDEALSPGDCIVETELGRVDGRIAVRVDALIRALTDRTNG